MNNMFFFFFNTEHRIGFKKLSAADLGLSENSNQTHIGLYEGVFTFLGDSDVVKTAMLVSNDYCDILSCNFDRIHNPDGSCRSPKIRKGSNNEDSIVSKIREFTKAKPNADWYLIWSGLESEELFFMLVNSESADYNQVRTLFPKENTVLDKTSETYQQAMDYLTKKVNMVSDDLQKDLETVSQTGKSKRIYKRKDIEKAEKIFKEIGLKGEELIAEYLDKEKHAGRINSYVWENKNSESGLPFDFLINDDVYVDVKTTNYDFEQRLFFSSQEIEFITETEEAKYSTFRVFDMKGSSKLKVCNNCLPYMNAMQGSIVDFVNKVNSQQAILQDMKFGIKPNVCFSNIQPSIIL